MATATATLAQLKLGDRVAQDVITPLGGVLFHKGKILSSRELDILEAFLIMTVEIEAKEPLEEKAADKATPEAAREQQPATDFYHEYVQMVALLRRVHSQYIAGQSMPILEIRTQLEATIKHIKAYSIISFLPSISTQGDYLFHSSVLSALTSYLLAQWSGYPQKDWMQVAIAGLFHDIGNAKIDPGIINKPSNLTTAEIEEMRRHTVLGYQMLRNVPAINEGVKLAALQHHEKIDGSGYPLGMDGDKIHPYAKIIAIADIYHAMTLKRSYRAPISPYLVLEQLQSESFGKLDPGLVRIFIEKTTQIHNGILVRLNDGRVGEIVFTDRNHLTRPWVNIKGTIVNLAVERQYYIDSIV